MRLILLLALAAAALAGPVWGQQPRGAGHWEGVIKGGNRDVPITVDLTPAQNGSWIGAMGMPKQGTKDVPLSGVTVQGDTVRFSMFPAPGSPVFEGKLTADGAAIAGKLSGGGESTPFELKRTGEAQIQPPPPSTPISGAFEGDWEGTLGDGDRTLRLKLKLRRAADGTGTGSLTTVGQDSPEIPITTVTQNADRLQFEIRAVGGAYSGKLDPAKNEISGVWTQAGSNTPLVFRKAGEPKK
jgi:hypothetical protein